MLLVGRVIIFPPSIASLFKVFNTPGEVIWFEFAKPKPLISHRQYQHIVSEQHFYFGWKDCIYRADCCFCRCWCRELGDESICCRKWWTWLVASSSCSLNSITKSLYLHNVLWHIIDFWMNVVKLVANPQKGNIHTSLDWGSHPPPIPASALIITLSMSTAL